MGRTDRICFWSLSRKIQRHPPVSKGEGGRKQLDRLYSSRKLHYTIILHCYCLNNRKLQFIKGGGRKKWICLYFSQKMHYYTNFETQHSGLGSIWIRTGLTLVPASVMYGKYRPDPIPCRLGFNFDGAARLLFSS